MSAIVFRAVKVGLLLTVAAGLAVSFSSGLRSVLLDAYLVAIGGVLLLALVRTTRVMAPADGPSSFDRALANMRRHPPDSGDLTLVRDLDLSIMSALHLHLRVRPLLREIAAHRLRVHYGVELDREAPRAAELVGPAAWDIVRPDRAPPDDRLSAGPPLAYFREVTAELERL
jgi:hypothetical protein